MIFPTQIEASHAHQSTTKAESPCQGHTEDTYSACSTSPVDDTILEPGQEAPYTLGSALKLVAVGTCLDKVAPYPDLESAAFTFLEDNFGMDEAGIAFRMMVCRIVAAYRIVAC